MELSDHAKEMLREEYERAESAVDYLQVAKQFNMGLEQLHSTAEELGLARGDADTQALAEPESISPFGDHLHRRRDF